MSKKCGHKRNLMTVERLLTRILPNTLMNRQNASKRLSRLSSPTFRWCRGCPVGTSAPRNLPCMCSWTVRGISLTAIIQVYGKEQNIGLHDVISPAAMAWVTVRETYIVDGIPTSIKADNTFCPFCAYTASNHRAINNHVWMHFRSHNGVWVARLLLHAHAVKENDRTQR